MYIHTHTYTHTKEHYSDIKKNEILVFAATWMDLENIILSEVSQTEKDKYDITYMWNLSNITTNVYTKPKQTHRHRKQTYGYQSEEGGKERQIRYME